MHRKYWVIIHRWLGLTMAGFLLVVGLTGSLLAFYAELDGWINPELYQSVHQDKPMMQLSALAMRAEEVYPHAMVTRVKWDTVSSVVVRMAPRINPETNQPYSLAFDQVFINPFTSEILGNRQFGDITQGMINFMPFIYKLHYELALSEIGMYLLGIIALIWTLDCFIGLYLTFPAKLFLSRRSHGFHQKSWLARWKPAWFIRWRASTYKLNFDMHRAGGLWLWIILLTFAWSSVYMNLWDTVYTKATQSVMDYKAYWTELKPANKTKQEQIIGWQEAEKISQRLLIEKSKELGFKVLYPVSIALKNDLGVYDYRARTSLDILDRGGQTQIYIDTKTGAFKLLLLPTSQYSGNTFTTWLYSLHMANVFGLSYKIFVSLLGFAIMMLSVTGVYIWLKKNRSRTFLLLKKKEII